LIIEWPLLSTLGKFAEKNKIPWVCLDRSPPADVGIFGTLQWIFWKRAWKQVSHSIQGNGLCLGGTVVSEAHQDYVHSRFKISKNEICVLHAGFNQKDIKPRERINDVNKEIHLVYHGRLDRHRGIMMLPLLLDKLSEENIPARLHLYGEGDCKKPLRSLSLSGRNLILHGKKDHRQVCRELGGYHIGLLPMPNQFVWTLASPIKRSEYLAANLCVIGVNHSGHQLDDLENKPWFRLLPQQDFVQFAFHEIKNMLSEKIFQTIGTEPRTYADKHFEWDIITSTFHEWLLNKSE
jgi:glycosyltransferase involved in cell wall biosynthesis